MNLGYFLPGCTCPVNLSGVDLTGMTCRDMYRPEGLGLENVKLIVFEPLES